MFLQAFSVHGGVPEVHPPRSSHPQSRHPLRYTPLDHYTPQDQVHPQIYTPQTRCTWMFTPQTRYTLGTYQGPGTAPHTRCTPWDQVTSPRPGATPITHPDIPSDQHPTGARLHPRDQVHPPDQVNQVHPLGPGGAEPPEMATKRILLDFLFTHTVYVNALCYLKVGSK